MIAGLLPNEEQWVDDQFSALLEGRRLVLQGLPRTGKSTLANGLAVRIGPTAVVVSGKDFTEQQQVEARERLLRDVRATVESHGMAQLIFDDFHIALGRSDGQRLQATLVSLLIDSRQSADIGALFLARWSGPIHLPGRGSPLITRCERVNLPASGQVDLDASYISVPLHQVAGEVGPFTAYLKMVSARGGSLDTSVLESHLDADCESILGDLTAPGVQVLSGTLDVAALRQTDLDPLRGLLHPGLARLSGAVRRSEAPAAAAQRASKWARTPDEAARQFVRYIEGHSSRTMVRPIPLQRPLHTRPVPGSHTAGDPCAPEASGCATQRPSGR